MKRYANLAGDSGVVAFDAGEGWIVVKFRDGGTYEYTDAVTGADHVAAMSRHAREGRGLATYINTHVRERYARKL